MNLIFLFTFFSTDNYVSERLTCAFQVESGAVTHSMCNIIPIILNLSKCFPLNNLHNFPRYYSPQENEQGRDCPFQWNHYLISDKILPVLNMDCTVPIKLCNLI